MIIWTYFRNPFILGGRVNQPTGCEIEVKEEQYLGQGYCGYEIITPKGNTIVVEKTSGAIIGDSINSVRNDITEGSPEVMKKQIEYACEELKSIKLIDQDEFWNTYSR